MERIEEVASDSGALGSRTGPSVTDRQSSVLGSGARGTAPRVGRPPTRTTPDPARSVSQAQNPLLPATTRAGLSRVRMKWTSEINTFIMRSYYTITRLETDISSYRQDLHRAFITEYPNTNVTEQRIADQRRVIVRNNLLPPNILQELREEVSLILRNNTTQTTQISTTQNNTTNNTPTLDTQSESSPVNHTTQGTQSNSTPSTQDNSPTPSENIDTPNLQTQNTPNLQPTTDTHTTQNTARGDPSLIAKVRQAFQEALTEFQHTQPTQRHTIPKQGTSHKFSNIINILNTDVLPQHLTENATFTDVHTAIYCAAVTATRCNGGKTFNSAGNGKNKVPKKPAWEKRLETRIDAIRRDLGRLTQYKNGNRSKRVVNKVNRILEKQKIHSNRDTVNTHIVEHIDTLTQKLAARTHRLRRYKQCTQRKTQNYQFENNQKKFYRSLGPHTNEIKELPSETSVADFWSSIWSEEKQHNPNACWIEEEKKRMQNTSDMPQPSISMTILTNAIQKTHNWKAPGTDHIQNYWYKKFTCTHKHLLQHINTFINNPETLPKFLTEGVTYMLPKDTNNTTDPSKYRPITCLQTLYKIITSCTSDLIHTHIHTNNILAEQQKGCRQGSQGCKEQLLIDSVILRQAKTAHRNIHVAYIDYKKAFDSVPHSWLVEVLHVYKIHPTLIHFLQHTMKHWNTAITLNSQNTQITTHPIHIRRGIFQGDSLSPLWFCLALNPLSHTLDATGYGFNIRHDKRTQNKITHLMYMDDIKLYSSTQTHLQNLIQTTASFSNDICMDFGMDKCRTMNVTKGKQELVGFDLQNGDFIDPMEEGEVYKYLGFQQAQDIQHKDIKRTLQEKYTNRLNSLLKTSLSGKNLVKAINTYAIPVLTYSFGIIKWTPTELEALDRKTRTVLTKYRAHHPRACTERLTLPRCEGGRGLVDIKTLHYKQVISIRDYFYTKQNDSSLHDAVIKADKRHTPLDLQNRMLDLTPHISSHTDKKQAWAQKSLHGRHYSDLNHTNVDKDASNAWLSRSDLFPETEGFMLAIQDKVVSTRNYRKHILNERTIENDNCRLCHTHTETIEHITDGCRLLAHTDYLHRHNQVCNVIHQELATKHNLINTYTPYYKYTPNSVIENTTHKMYYDRSIITDRLIHHNRPDITLIDKHNKTTYLIDIAIPNTHNIHNTHREKITKYTDLAHEVQRLWKMDKVIIVPIIMSSTAVVPKTLHTSIDTLKLHKNTLYTIQKAVILNTCRSVRKFLTYTDNITHTTDEA